MSLHRQSQFQRATDRITRTIVVPRYRYRGTFVRICWRLEERCGCRRAPSGEHASKTITDSGQRLFAILFHSIEETPETRDFRMCHFAPFALAAARNFANPMKKPERSASKAPVRR
jgi:hypothetical protein